MTTRLVPCLVVFWLGLSGGTAERTCAEGDVRVEAVPAVAERVCSAVDRARDVLAECGLVQRRPITVRTVDSLDSVHGPCVAMYDCASDTLTTLRPDGMGDAPLGPAFSAIPEEDLFDALILHELTHAFIDHASGPGVPGIAHEYLAYAIEIEALPAESRSAFLAAVPGATGGLETIDPLALLFAPELFAANAYLHYSAPGNGCALARRILAGDRSLPPVFVPASPRAETD